MRIGEQQITAAARAHQLARCDIDDVLMLVGDRLGAHLAALAGRLDGPLVGPDPRQHVVGAAPSHHPGGLGEHRDRQHAVAKQQRDRVEM